MADTPNRPLGLEPGPCPVQPFTAQPKMGGQLLRILFEAHGRLRSPALEAQRVEPVFAGGADVAHLRLWAEKSEMMGETRGDGSPIA